MAASTSTSSEIFLVYKDIFFVISCQYFLVFSNIFQGVQLVYHDDSYMDILRPYLIGRHGPRHSNRYVRDCQHVKYGNVTHEMFKANVFNTSHESAKNFYNFKFFRKNIGSEFYKHYITGHYIRVDAPLSTVSVLEPGGPSGCKKHSRSTVKDTSYYGKCVAAVNAGLFNTTDGSCLGNVITNGKLMLDSGGIQNAHFGITEDGYIYTGYLTEKYLSEIKFKHLVGGVVWLLRNGESYVDASLKAECSDSQETGTLKRFINVISARTAVGHDKDGRVVFVQVNGKTDIAGINLYDFAKLLKEIGVVNAINLDGGGSSTMVYHDVVVNIPSDRSKEPPFARARQVSTVVCVHEPYCEPRNCSGNGKCVMGNCKCDGMWSGSSCDYLKCPLNCSNHGTCRGDGCICDSGYIGESCNQTCPHGKYGYQCKMNCLCNHNAGCNPKNGSCYCPSGYTGHLCENLCPVGTYGKNCQGICFCLHSCVCHHATGDCNSTYKGPDTMHAAKCIAKKLMEENHLVKAAPEQYRLWVIGFVILATVAAASLILNISLICAYCRNSKPGHQRLSKSVVKNRRYSPTKKQLSINLFSEDSSEDESGGEDGVLLNNLSTTRS